MNITTTDNPIVPTAADDPRAVRLRKWAYYRLSQCEREDVRIGVIEVLPLITAMRTRVPSILEGSCGVPTRLMELKAKSSAKLLVDPPCSDRDCLQHGVARCFVRLIRALDHLGLDLEMHHVPDAAWDALRKKLKRRGAKFLQLPLPDGMTLAITPLHDGNRIDDPVRFMFEMMRGMPSVPGRRRSTDGSWTLDPKPGTKYRDLGRVKKGLRKAQEIAREEGLEPHDRFDGIEGLDGVQLDALAPWKRFVQRAGVELEDAD